MRILQGARELTYEPEQYTHKQDNNQNSQQANSQNISLYLPEPNKCKGNVLTIELRDKQGNPKEEKIDLLWGGIEVGKANCDQSGRIAFNELPCGFYIIRLQAVDVAKVKLLGNETKEVFLII